MFSSCTDPGVDPIGPEITLSANNVTEITTGESLLIEGVITAGDANLETVIVEKDGGVVYTISSDVNSTSFDKTTIQLSYTNANLTVGTYVFTITATDKDGVETVETVNVVVASDLTNNGTKILGAGNNDAGSFYSLNDNAVLLQAAAEAAPDKVTLVYNYSTTDGAQLYSGTESANTIINAGASETNLVKLTGVTFATVTGADVPAVITATKLTNLVQGDVIAFQTSGVIGIVEITALTATADGMVTLSVKSKTLTK
jgi:hypothetical protein